MGGNNNNNPNYLRNPYGDLYLGGYANTMDRMAHINVGIDVDFSWLTEGLSFKTYFGTDNYNKYTTTQNNSYASYEPAFGDDGTIRIANIYGSNDFVGSQTMTDTGFYRRLGWNNALSYDRTFSGRHQLSAVLMSTMHHYKESGATHAEKSVNFGGRVNYAFADQVRGGVQRRLYRFDLPVARQPVGATRRAEVWGGSSPRRSSCAEAVG